MIKTFLGGYLIARETFRTGTAGIKMSQGTTFNLRWPNTVFARAFADVIQRVHKDCKNKHVVNRAIILFI